MEFELRLLGEENEYTKVLSLFTKGRVRKNDRGKASSTPPLCYLRQVRVVVVVVVVASRDT